MRLRDSGRFSLPLDKTSSVSRWHTRAATHSSWWAHLAGFTLGRSVPGGVAITDVALRRPGVPPPGRSRHPPGRGAGPAASLVTARLPDGSPASVLARRDRSRLHTRCRDSGLRGALGRREPRLQQVLLVSRCGERFSAVRPGNRGRGSKPGISGLDHSSAPEPGTLPAAPEPGASAEGRWHSAEEGRDQFQQLVSMSSGFMELLPAALRSQSGRESTPPFIQSSFLGEGSVARSTRLSFSLKILVLLIHRFGSLL